MYSAMNNAISAYQRVGVETGIKISLCGSADSMPINA